MQRSYFLSSKAQQMSGLLVLSVFSPITSRANKRNVQERDVVKIKDSYFIRELILVVFLTDS